MIILFCHCLKCILVARQTFSFGIVRVWVWNVIRCHFYGICSLSVTHKYMLFHCCSTRQKCCTLYIALQNSALHCRRKWNDLCQRFLFVVIFALHRHFYASKHLLQCDSILCWPKKKKHWNVWRLFCVHEYEEDLNYSSWITTAKKHRNRKKKSEQRRKMVYISIHYAQTKQHCCIK